MTVQNFTHKKNAVLAGECEPMNILRMLFALISVRKISVRVKGNVVTKAVGAKRELFQRRFARYRATTQREIATTTTLTMKYLKRRLTVSVSTRVFTKKMSPTNYNIYF